MTAIVITGGRGPDISVIRPHTERADILCACDSGYELARSYGLSVDIVVGDMDSISSLEVLSSVPRDRIIEYDHEKDETDTEIGVRTVKERGATEVVIIGGGGGRLDHLLGIVSIFHRDAALTSWLTHRDEIVQITDMIERTDLRGQTVSFFPLAGEECRIRTEGLKWPLDELRWKVGNVGISNVVVSTRLRVSMESGRIIMVRSHGG